MKDEDQVVGPQSQSSTKNQRKDPTIEKKIIDYFVEGVLPVLGLNCCCRNWQFRDYDCGGKGFESLPDLQGLYSWSLQMRTTIK
jgi:hypothetical protein